MWLYLFFIVVTGHYLLSSIDGLSMLYQFHYQKEKDATRALYQVLRTCCWITYLLMYQKVVKNVENVGGNQFDVHYVLGNQLYKFRIEGRKGPSQTKVLQVIDRDNNDVTRDIVPYLGPKEDWHRIVYEPSILGYDVLTFNLSDGTNMTFHKEDSIVLALKSSTKDEMARGGGSVLEKALNGGSS